MKHKYITALISVLTVLSFASVACAINRAVATDNTVSISEKLTENAGSTNTKSIFVTPTQERIKLKDGFSAVRFDGDYGFDNFIAQGGASSDAEVVNYLADYIISNSSFSFLKNLFGCSTLSVKTTEGDYLFGRNFDWGRCEALAVISKSENNYASISTVNTDFISIGKAMTLLNTHPDIITVASLYAPLDGMNEKGFCVSVNMIQDSDTINQNTDKPDITTTTATRLLLNKAANVDEAIAILDEYDMHASMGMMVHFALADTEGRSVVIEYVDNKMVVTDTPVVTNFYLSEGKKYGIGTSQSHERYGILMERLSNISDTSDVKDALDRVSKDNFNEFESTEWSIVFNQSRKEATYYHRENYDEGFTFKVE